MYDITEYVKTTPRLFSSIPSEQTLSFGILLNNTYFNTIAESLFFKTTNQLVDLTVNHTIPEKISTITQSSLTTSYTRSFSYNLSYSKINCKIHYFDNYKQNTALSSSVWVNNIQNVDSIILSKTEELESGDMYTTTTYTSNVAFGCNVFLDFFTTGNPFYHKSGNYIKKPSDKVESGYTRHQITGNVSMTYSLKEYPLKQGSIAIVVWKNGKLIENS